MNLTINRYDYIDIMKGIGIILVVLGHTWYLSEGITKYIYSFHMPLFFFISGYLYNKEKYTKLSTLANNKFKCLIVPYLIFSLLSLPITYKYNHNLISVFKSLIFYEERSWNSPLWFLLCLFVVYMLYYYIIKLSDKYTDLTSLIIFSAGYILYIFKTKLPLGLDISMVAILFFHLGSRTKNVKIKSNHLHEIICLVVSIVFGYFLNGRVNMSINNCGNLVYFLLGSISGIALILMLSLQIHSNKLLNYLGKNSLIIMCLHYFTFLIFGFLIKKAFGISMDNSTNNILALLQAITSLLSIIPMIYIINKKLKFILGKF